jgi:hypothetical protein
LVEETGGPGENHRPVASHWQTLSHNVVHLALIEIRTHNRWMKNILDTRKGSGSGNWKHDTFSFGLLWTKCRLTLISRSLILPIVEKWVVICVFSNNMWNQHPKNEALHESCAYSLCNIYEKNWPNERSIKA